MHGHWERDRATRCRTSRGCPSMPVIVATVGRGLRFRRRWSTASVAPSPEMRSTFGRLRWVMYWRTNGESPLQVPQLASLCRVSMAGEVLPLPLTPVKAASRPLGMLTDTSRRLLVRAPVDGLAPHTRDVPYECGQPSSTPSQRSRTWGQPPFMPNKPITPLCDGRSSPMAPSGRFIRSVSQDVAVPMRPVLRFRAGTPQ